MALNATFIKYWCNCWTQRRTLCFCLLWNINTWDCFPPGYKNWKNPPGRKGPIFMWTADPWTKHLQRHQTINLGFSWPVKGGDGKCNERGGGRAPPTPPSPARQILPSWLNVRQKSAVTTLCTLWGELERRSRGASLQEGSKIPTWLTISPVYKLYKTPIETTFRVWCLIYSYLVDVLTHLYGTLWS
jgi:hypothetical protein